MASIRLDSHVDPGELETALAEDARAGLTATPKELPPKWFYDEEGSHLFERITTLPEYYPPRRERQVLRHVAGEIAASTGADTLVELGSGSSEKTRLLLDAFGRTGSLRRYIPVDVSLSALLPAAHAVAADYPTLEVHAVRADFERHLDQLPAGGRRLTAFLGSTIGNLRPEQRAVFFAEQRERMDGGDALLLGTDLVKDPTRLVSAYDDAAGVTAAFNRNLLHVLNRELKGDFDPQAFAHVALWDPVAEWIEMRLRSTRDQRVNLAKLDLGVRFAAGEDMRTEISAKFRRERVEAEYAAAGLRLSAWWTDTGGDYALSLAVPA
jgi:L-histidine N-alpha-methyltransferase